MQLLFTGNRGKLIAIMTGVNSIGQQSGSFFELPNAAKDKMKVAGVALSVLGLIAYSSKSSHEFYSRAFSFGLQSFAISAGITSGHFYSMTFICSLANTVITPGNAMIAAQGMGFALGFTRNLITGYEYALSAGVGLALGWVPGECFSKNICLDFPRTINKLTQVGLLTLIGGTISSSMIAVYSFCGDRSVSVLSWFASKVTRQHW